MECFQCRGAHYANDCKFKDTVCHSCSKKRHLAENCRSTKIKAKPGQGKVQQAQAAAHHINEKEEEAECAYNMFGMETDEEPPEPYYATLSVNGKVIQFEIDSGATASVISAETYRKR